MCVLILWLFYCVCKESNKQKVNGRERGAKNKNIRVQHSVPSLLQLVQRLEPGYAKNPDPHLTRELNPSLFAHVLAARHVCVNIRYVIELSGQATTTTLNEQKQISGNK